MQTLPAKVAASNSCIPMGANPVASWDARSRGNNVLCKSIGASIVRKPEIWSVSPSGGYAKIM